MFTKRKKKLTNSTTAPKKRYRRSLTLELKMEVIRRVIEVGESRTNVSRTMNLPPSTVSTIITNSEKIKQSIQQMGLVPNNFVDYPPISTRERLIEKMEDLLTVWIEDMKNRKGVCFLTKSNISKKAVCIFEELKAKEGDSNTERFLATNGWFTNYRNRTKPKMSNDNSTTRCYVMNQRKTQKVKTEEDSSTFSSQYNSLSQPTVAKFKKKTTEQFENQSLEKKAQIISTQPAPRQKQVLAPPIQVAAAKPKPVEKPRPREKRMFVISDHQHCVMSNLSSLWRCGKLCDAGIGNGKSTIMVHKVVLSAVCPKLLSVFSTDMLSQTFLEVNFPEEVSTEALNAFAEYMYNGILDLDPVILEQLKIIARRLDMNEFEQLCDSHLPNHIHQPAAAAAASFADFPMIQATMPISAMSSLGPTISSTSIQSAPSFATHVINIKQENFDVELAQIQNDAAAMFAQESEVVSLASNKSRNDAGFVICSNIKTEPIGPEDDRYGRVSNSSINQTFTSTTSSSLSSLATDSAPISSVSKSFTKYPIPFLRSTNIKSTTLKRSRCYEVPLVSNLTPEPIIVQRMHSQTNCINKDPPKIPSPTSNSLSSVTDFATSSNNTVYPVRLFTARGDNLPLMETHLSDVMSINSPPD